MLQSALPFHLQKSLTIPLSHYFIGYRVSFVGSFIGFFYGFALGTLGGAFIGWLYNRIVDLKKQHTPDRRSVS